ncbi:MAG: Druantia anti-phage system protein DruA, partial [Burkholderiales bacterium]
MSCRVALGKLARAGLLDLPAPRQQPATRARGMAHAQELPELTSVKAPLAKLGRIELVLVKSRHSRAARLWRAVMQRYHYLGAGPLCGAQLRYLVRAEHHGIVGAAAFSAAAWRVRARDRFIGWSDQARAANLNAVVANSRFLIVPQVQVPHLASHVLGLCVKHLRDDWAARYGVHPVLLETFVERGRFRGTCYRAANWQHVGATCGRGRQDRRHAHAIPVKDIYLYPLQRDWRERLQAFAPQARANSVAPKRSRAASHENWAAEEFSAAKLGDARLEARLMSLARDFYAQPRA